MNSPKGRWIIVSNRLPFSYDENSRTLTPSSGGLVTAIRGIDSKADIHWIGSLPSNVPRELVKDAKAHDSERGNIDYSFPEIPLDLYESYYNGFCNDALWPILHYETESVKARPESWEAYKEVNRRFAQHILEVANENDLIWIHDFHLFLTPKLIKEKSPRMKTGFFLHVPFPSSEIWRQLPYRKEILTALLHADLLGFHDFAYLRHFASSVYNLLGLQSSLLEIISAHNKTKLGVYPVSIDTQDFIKKAESSKTQEEIERYGLKKDKYQYVLGVDRLDYSKGLLLKLEAFRAFLKQNPEYVGKVQLIQIAVPSRTDVPEYIKLRHDVERLVSEINGEFSNIDYIPVNYIFNSVTTHELMALYRACDILLVSSKRDGMNLVSLEYIAAQDEKNPGVVMLSEFAGAASTLSHAIIINPMDIEDTALKLRHSLEMPKEERITRHHTMLGYLEHYTATAWASAFINHLRKKNLGSYPNIQDLNKASIRAVLREKYHSKKKALLLDYDGTLTPIVNEPKDAGIQPAMKELITSLQARQDTEVIIVSGRDSEFIQKQFKGVDCYLACEHGAKFYDYRKQKWRNLVSSDKSQWFDQASQIIQEYTRRTPNSFYEKKNYSIAWHYRKSPKDFGKFQARKLAIDLEAGLSHLPISVISGKKVVEVKAIEANKGYFAQWFKSRYLKEGQAIFAIGDDQTDEDMFTSLKGNANCVRVGTPEKTSAGYYLEHQEDVFGLLRDLFLNEEELKRYEQGQSMGRKSERPLEQSTLQ